MCSGIATPGSDSTQELNDFDSQGSVKDGSLEDSLEMTSQTLDVSDTPSEKVDVLASVSQGIGTILEALECPTLASEPTAYQNTPGEPTPVSGSRTQSSMNLSGSMPQMAEQLTQRLRRTTKIHVLSLNRRHQACCL